MAAGLGETQLRRLITEYRAKQAMIDMKQWSNAFKQLLNNNFGGSIGPEGKSIGLANWIEVAPWKATPYAKTANDGTGLLTPDSLTTPGWSGANQVPLKAAGTTASVDFQPIGANMTCQLCYRTATDNYPVYGAPVSSGTCSLRLDKAPISGVVIVVICNTDYKYAGETTRKAHYDYRLKLGSGMTVADVNTKWYNVNLPVAPAATVDRTTSIGPLNASLAFSASFNGRRSLTLWYDIPAAGAVSISICSPAGVVIRNQLSGIKQPGHYTETVTLANTGISCGAYAVQIKTAYGSTAQKVLLVK
jgi:hypothetical protein